MGKRAKLSRIILRTPQIISQLLYIEEQISRSHLKEKIHEEHVAVSKIKVDSKHLFRYAKIYIICEQEFGPLLSHATREDDLFLTDITLSDSIIIEAIKELPQIQPVVLMASLRLF